VRDEITKLGQNRRYQSGDTLGEYGGKEDGKRWVFNFKEK